MGNIKLLTKSNPNHYFVAQLLKWNNDLNKRQMPWKGEKDPYKIWLSEIILQQTRVEQGFDYYNKFILSFPNIKLLAAASDTVIFKLWEGLGYYSRCKNMIVTAKYIANHLNGIFPSSYYDILGLKGVGPYTAAAIASFAFNLPYAVVDGNVFRVLSRFFGISTPIDSADGKNAFTLLANELLNKTSPGNYNQAIMDFGAVICKPKIPLCSSCLLQNKCVAYKKELVNSLPVKEKRIAKKTRWFYYLVIEYNGMLYIRKRTAKDIWQNLYEFVLLEKDEVLLTSELLNLKWLKELVGNQKFSVTSISQVYKQQLTHQTINGQFIKMVINQPLVGNVYDALLPDEIDKLPFPKFITTFLQDKNVSLNLF